MSHKNSFIADQRGAVAFEMPIVWLFLMMSLLLPLADVAVAGFQFVSAWEALRAFGQSIQYDPPPDVTNASGWTSSKLAKADPRYPINNFNSFAAMRMLSALQATLLRPSTIHTRRPSPCRRWC